MNQWLKVSVLTGATVLAGTLYFSGISWAQTTTITSTTSTTSTAPAVVDAAPRLWGKQGLFTPEERSAMIAEALGMTPAELQKAQKDGTNLRKLAAARGLDRKTIMDSLRAAMEKHLQKAVEAGRVTQAQAESIRQHFSQRSGFMQGRGGRGQQRDGGQQRGGGQQGGRQQRGGGQQAGARGGMAWMAEREAILAEALGMPLTDLNQALRNGQTPQQLAKAKGLAPQAFQTALTQATEKHLQLAVKAGRLTQAQADRIMQQMRNPNDGPGRHAFGRGGRHPHQRGSFLWWR